MAFRRSALYFAILSMSLAANSSAAPAACPPLPEVADEAEDDPARSGTTFSLRDVDALADDAVRLPSRLPPEAGFGLLPLVLPLLLLIACALSASFSWHIMLSRREMGVDSGPKKSEMVLERVFRKASFRLRDDLWGGRDRCCWWPAEVAANADGVEGGGAWWAGWDGE